MTTLEEFESMLSERGLERLALVIPCRAGMDPDEVAGLAAEAARKAYIARFGGAE